MTKGTALCQSVDISEILLRGRAGLPYYCGRQFPFMPHFASEIHRLFPDSFLDATTVNSPGTFSFVQAGCSSNFSKRNPQFITALMISLTEMEENQ